MRLKRFVSAFVLTAAFRILSVNAIADNSGNEINREQFADVLVSFLYFAGVLVLIYVILVLVNKWGKKHQKDGKDGENEKNKAKKEDNESSLLKKSPDGKSEKTDGNMRKSDNDRVKSSANTENIENTGDKEE